MARSAGEGLTFRATCTAPTAIAVANAPTGWVLRKITGMVTPRMTGIISHSRTTRSIARPTNASIAASTPSTSRGWRRSHAYSADTAPGYPRASRITSSRGLGRRSSPGMICGTAELDVEYPEWGIKLDAVAIPYGLQASDLDAPPACLGRLAGRPR